MTTNAIDASPQRIARFGGALYLFILVASGFAELYVRGGLIVSGDPIGTAKNILASEPLFRISIAGEVLNDVCDVALSWVLYVLLRPVNRNLSLLAAFFRLVSATILCINKLSLFVALFFLEKTDISSCLIRATAASTSSTPT